MKIEKIYVRNYKGAREVEIHANPTVNELAGPNEAGKSSILDAIEGALAGARHIAPESLRRGASKGETTLDLGDIIVTRSMTAKNASRGGTLKITANDGSKWGQRDLNELFCDFSFDPLAFTRMRPADQVAVLQQLAGQEFCAALADKDEAIKDAMESRREINATIKRMGSLPQVEEVQPVDVARVSEELREAQKHNAMQDEQQRHIDALNREVERHRVIVEKLRESLEEAEQDLMRWEKDLGNATPPAAHINTDELQQRMVDASEQNAKATAWKSHQRRLAEHQQLASDSVAADRRVERLREDREELARTATLPVPGLEWTDDGVTLDGLPFAQLSSSKKLRVAGLMGMAQRPGLQIMFIRDGSLLDDDSFAELVMLAKDHNYQLWVETVGRGHNENAIIIEAGEVAEAGGDRPF